MHRRSGGSRVSAAAKLATAGFSPYVRACLAAVLLAPVALVAMTISSSAAPPIQYVQICDRYGYGFFYIPGTDDCFKQIGRNLYDYRPVPPTATLRPDPWQEGFCQQQGGGFHWDPRGNGRQCIVLDKRTEPASGTVRSYDRLGQPQGDLVSNLRVDQTWGGFSIGVHGAAVWGQDRWSESDGHDLGTGHSSGAAFGIQGGYMAQLGNGISMGVQAHADWGSARSKFDCNSWDCGSAFRSIYDLDARVGYSVDPSTQVYLQGGPALVRDRVTSHWNFPDNANFRETQWNWGGTIGGGVERRVANYLSVFAEYNYYNFGKNSAVLLSNSIIPTFPVDIERQFSVVRVGANAKLWQSPDGFTGIWQRPDAYGWTGWYAGIEGTQTRGELEITEFDRFLDRISFHSCDWFDPFGIGVVAGYAFNWNGFRVSPFVSLDYPNQTLNHVFPGGSYIGTRSNLVGTAGAKAGPVIALVPSMPVLWLYGILGASVLNQDLNIAFGGPVSTSNQTILGATYGVGLSFQPSLLQGLGRPVSLFVEYQLTEWQHADFNAPAASPGFNYRFGREDEVIKFGFTIALAGPTPPPPYMPVKAPRVSK